MQRHSVVTWMLTASLCIRETAPNPSLFRGSSAGVNFLEIEMLGWIAERQYNRFDPLWIALVALAIRDDNWFAAAVFVVIGVSISVVIEHLAKRATKHTA